MADDFVKALQNLDKLVQDLPTVHVQTAAKYLTSFMLHIYQYDL